MQFRWDLAEEAQVEKQNSISEYFNRELENRLETRLLVDNQVPQEGTALVPIKIETDEEIMEVN